MRLLFTTGSPFARAVRVVLDEIGLDWERIEEITTPAVEERAAHSPTLQVPTLHDGDRTLWESGLVCEYLMRRHPGRRGGPPPLGSAVFRAEREWDDRLVLATIQTLGTAITTVSQMTWGGAGVGHHSHADRCAARVPPLLDWLETRLPEEGEGFLPGVLSLQDVLLVCHVEFARNRPIGIGTELDGRPKLAALLARVAERSSFRANPILWWDPEVTGYGPDGTPLRG